MQGQRVVNGFCSHATNLCTLGEELEAEERVDEDEDEPDELRRGRGKTGLA
jgi:hypothetical protein